ncbi:phage tail domain-containing protein [Lacticaseibacillus baoqingensis]|uniref:Phage tail domain-containing protein n=1 Tax=Lacticaseibacillus baoqingensis TaxID=2486013 RepID=A0ABW4E9L5_9LACO|nr:phage tail domain-containing protein [Lacticaseibacillus baoqingensis]
MDLLIEKLDGSRYYLSQYKVLITEFEESAPSVTRNNMQLDQRNGNIDFGGWQTGKTINITGYYRADDMDEEEVLREKLYALLSDPDGYYITQLKTTHETAVERPGETSGGYYDKLKDYPSHKRFLVYTEAPELELVGNVGGTLLYKITAEFKTIKLPYGESVQQDLYVKPNVPYYGRNLIIRTGEIVNTMIGADGSLQAWGSASVMHDKITVTAGEKLTFHQEQPVDAAYCFRYNWYDTDGTYLSRVAHPENAIFTVTVPENAAALWVSYPNVGRVKVERGTTATPWSPAPEDSEYNSWRYGLNGNVSIPYSGTVPCNQLEQQFAIELTAMGGASSLSFKIDDTELTYSGAVADGDVFMFSGFSYTQNGLSIVSKTNKAYFILQPDKPNRITCNVPGTVKILGFQNLYA